MKIRIGTRGSELALWQAKYVSSIIGEDRCEIIVLKTQGDKIQNVSFDKMEGKGFFTKEIEDALLDNKIDLAVHSMKDLPTESIPELYIAAITEREDPADVLLINKESFIPTKKLPVKENSVIGTSSMRRLAQLKNLNREIDVKALRGNINTRLRKLREKEYSAIMMAYAGIKRINLDVRDFELYKFPFEHFLPAPAQGALALQVRTGDNPIIEVLAQFNHEDTVTTVTAERTFLNNFGGGCHIPLGAYGKVTPNGVELSGVIASTNGASIIRHKIKGEDPIKVGKELSDFFKSKGADKLI